MSGRSAQAAEAAAQAAEAAARAAEAAAQAAEAAARAAEAAARAAEFVAASGTAADRAALAAFTGRGGLDRVAEALGPPPDDLPAFRRALRLFDDLDALDHPFVQGIARDLDRLQAEDGHWGEDAEDAIFDTGTLGGHLAKAPSASARLLDAAGDWLAARFSPERVQGFQWRGVAAYAHLFANLSHEKTDEILQWCGRELERGFRARRFDAVHTARVLVWCGAPCLPGARFEGAELLEALLIEQAADGGYGTRDRLRCSWDAMVALVNLAHTG
ncbi:MAG: hypothetical protein GY772_14385 [bacterium]|nr:hypothetical protein [bacterium]MDP6073445.1 hypothetical protein [Myxococcota bacterium]MDP7074484.1 hypothetical protein [Myxococcota bacterium]MDP7301366.1 hypothetical protein [Myxococcota bacterium]MDP7570121.1 hypothetical protein [Myxococcota bacterium]